MLEVALQAVGSNKSFLYRAVVLTHVGCFWGEKRPIAKDYVGIFPFGNGAQSAVIAKGHLVVGINKRNVLALCQTDAQQPSVKRSAVFRPDVLCTEGLRQLSVTYGRTVVHHYYFRVRQPAPNAFQTLFQHVRVGVVDANYYRKFNHPPLQNAIAMPICRHNNGKISFIVKFSLFGTKTHKICKIPDAFCLCKNSDAFVAHTKLTVKAENNLLEK